MMKKKTNEKEWFLALLQLHLISAGEATYKGATARFARRKSN